MSSLILTVDSIASSHIYEAIDDAIKLAKQLDCMVSFSFNGITVNANKHSNPEVLYKQWDYEIRDVKLLKDFKPGDRIKNTLDDGLPIYKVIAQRIGTTELLSEDGLTSHWNCANKNFVEVV